MLSTGKKTFIKPEVVFGASKHFVLVTYITQNKSDIYIWLLEFNSDGHKLNVCDKIIFPRERKSILKLDWVSMTKYT